MKQYQVKEMCGLLACMILISGLLLTGCAGDSEAYQAKESETAAAKVGAPGATEYAKTSIGAYLGLKDALVQGDAAAASRSAESLANMLGAENAAGSAELQESAKAIAASNDLKVQRQHFFTLSTAMISLVEQGKESNRTLYVQHCPMAFDFTGADWISDARDIRNPYFGDEMLTCGFVKSELAIAKAANSAQ